MIWADRKRFNKSIFVIHSEHYLYFANPIVFNRTFVHENSFSSLRFDSSVSPLIFGDQFMKLSTKLSSPLLYGLGEHEQPLLMNVTYKWKKLSFWARDVPPAIDTNLYGK